MKYMIAAHPIQQALLNEVIGKGFDDLSLRDMGEKIGVGASPQKIKHHLGQMIKYGYVDVIEGRYRVGKTLKVSR